MFFCCSSRGVSTKPPLLQVTSRSLRSLTLQLVHLSNTLHISLFAATNASSFKTSSRFLALSASDAFSISANSPAVLIFHDQLCLWSSPSRQRFDVVEPSHVQLVILKLFLHSCRCCWECSLWLLGPLLHLHVLLQLLLRLRALVLLLLAGPVPAAYLSAVASLSWLRDALRATSSAAM